MQTLIERDDESFVSLCPELNIASQGSSVEEAQANLVEALTLFFETADPSEVTRRFHSEIFGLRFPLGKLRVLSGSELYRILEQNAFVEVRQRGSHRIMQKRIADTTVTVPVLLHESVRRGTLSSFVRQSELPRALLESGR
ncbi:MAG: type II toxin-antitoxin system HicA family toxin [Bryobacteraceae bacterium]|jgi:predicted RNA binding protein YcfA (HicA-like mRNA interferase family)